LFTFLSALAGLIFENTKALHVLKFLMELMISFTYIPLFHDFAEWITSLSLLQRLSFRALRLGDTPSPPFNQLTSNLLSFNCEVYCDMLSWLSTQAAFRSLQELRLRMSTTDLKAAHCLRQLPFLIHLGLRIKKGGTIPCELTPLSNSPLLLIISNSGTI
jgi:hypothetical protein